MEAKVADTRLVLADALDLPLLAGVVAGPITTGGVMAAALEPPSGNRGVV
ncbi:MAG: hypothetical protein ACKVP3_24640 [Hyphomicrobiaceae bacterium]